MTTEFADRLRAVRDRIHAAEQRFQRPPGAVRLLAVSKTQPVTAVAAMAAAGQTGFGENYVQEALDKMTELAALSGRQVPNLSRTLRMMEGYGLVALTKNARQTRPTALATEFLVVLD